jgi:twitching motility protein PilT
MEVCINTGRVQERILDPTRSQEIEEVVADGSFYGMQTFDQALVELVKAGRVTFDDAVESSSNRHDLELAMQQAGVAVTA